MQFNTYPLSTPGIIEGYVLLGEKSRSLALANDAKAGEQSIFGEIYTIHIFGMPSIRNLTTLHFGLAN